MSSAGAPSEMPQGAASWRALFSALWPALVVAVGVRAWALADLSGSFLQAPLLLDHDYYWTWAGDIARGKLVGDDAFEMDPLYAYWLGLWRALLGDSLWVPRGLNLVHALFAVVGCGLLARDAVPRRSSSTDEQTPDEDDSRALESADAVKASGSISGVGLRRARRAGLAMALFPVTLFYDLLVMKTSMMVALLPWALWLGWRAADQRRAAPALLAGGVFALGCTLRGNLLPLLPLFVWLVGGQSWRAWRAVLSDQGPRRRVGAFLLGTSLVLALPLAHNLKAAGSFTLLTTGGGAVFYLGTLDEGGGEYVKLPFVRPHPRLEHQDFRDEAARRLGVDTLDRATASRYWWVQGLERIGQRPLRHFQLELNKALLLTGSFEHPDSASYYFWAGLITPLGLLGPLHFGVLFPLALAGLLGLALLRVRWRWSVAAVAFGYLSVFLLFFVYARFRVPVTALLVVCAIVGGEALWRQRQQRPRVLAAALAVLLGSALVSAQRSSADPQQELGLQYLNYATWYLADQQPAAAEALLERAAETGNAEAAALLGQLWLERPARREQGAALIRFAAARAPTVPRVIEARVALHYAEDDIAEGDALRGRADLVGAAALRLDRARRQAQARAVTRRPPTTP